MADKKKHRIKIQGHFIEVSEEIYITYYRMAACARFLRRKDKLHGLVSYNELDTDELRGEETIPDMSAESVESQAIARILSDKLHQCLNMLPTAERELLHALYFENLSEQALSSKTGVSQQVIHYRKKQALANLRTLMDS